MTNIRVIIDPKKSSTFDGAYARITRINGNIPLTYKIFFLCKKDKRFPYWEKARHNAP